MLCFSYLAAIAAALGGLAKSNNSITFKEIGKSVFYDPMLSCGCCNLAVDFYIEPAKRALWAVCSSAVLSALISSGVIKVAIIAGIVLDVVRRVLRVPANPNEK